MNTWKLEIQPELFCFKNIFNYRDDNQRGRKSRNCSQASQNIKPGKKRDAGNYYHPQPSLPWRTSLVAMAGNYTSWSATNSENRHAIYDKSSKFCSDLNLNMNFLSGGGLQKIPRKHLVLISSILESDPGLMISSGSYHWL